MSSFTTPQEVEVWVLIPAIRRQIAISLKERGLKYREISKVLGVTVPAISQYINNKRAKKAVFSEEVKNRIEKSLDKIQKGKSNINKELQLLLQHINKKKILCKECKCYCDVPENCDICY